MKQSFVQSFCTAVKGIGYCLLYEKNFKRQAIVALLVITAGFYFELSQLEWLFVILAIVLVLAAEAFNTAIEQLCNHVCPQHDPAIGLIKDISAAVVLLVTIGASTGGVLLFAPKFIHHFIK